MSVKIKKRGSKWYVYVNYHGRRKNRAVGTREAAESVRRALEVRLALGDASFLSQSEHEVPTFRVYAEQWLKTCADVQCKQSTRRSYEQLLRLHVTPRFGSKLLTDIRRDEVKRFIAELSQATREVNGSRSPTVAEACYLALSEIVIAESSARVTRSSMPRSHLAQLKRH